MTDSWKTKVTLTNGVICILFYTHLWRLSSQLALFTYHDIYCPQSLSLSIPISHPLITRGIINYQICRNNWYAIISNESWEKNKNVSNKRCNNIILITSGRHHSRSMRQRMSKLQPNISHYTLCLLENCSVWWTLQNE